MFSRRIASLPGRNRLAEAIERRRTSGHSWIDLTISNPTCADLPMLADGLDALSGTASLRYAPDPRGLASARDAVAEELTQEGVAVDPERLVLTASTSEAYSYLFKLLCDPGDSVLVPRPSYPLVEWIARLESVELSPYDLRYDGRWHIDLESVRRALGPRARAILCVSPNNPTGSFLGREELGFLASLRLPILSDEVFSAYALHPDAERVASVLELNSGLVFALGGLSKHIAMPQLKLAWMAAGGDPERVSEALGRLDVIADTYLSVSTPVQCALGELLRAGAATREAIGRRIATNAHVLSTTLTDTVVTPLHIEGGWYGVVQFPSFATDEQWAFWLLDQGVLVHPGYLYDFQDPSMAVLSLLTPPQAFHRGCLLLKEIAEEKSA